MFILNSLCYYDCNSRASNTTIVSNTLFYNAHLLLTKLNSLEIKLDIFNYIISTEFFLDFLRFATYLDVGLE